MYKHELFINSVNESFTNYNKFGKRSSRKISPIHNYLADVLSSIFGEEYSIHCIDRNSEYKVKGKYYRKNIDITVVKDSEPVFCLGVKFITSNFKQNANNYFESMLGETANIQTANNVPYAHVIIFRRETPYFKIDGSIKKIEVINDSDMEKYIKLMFDFNHAHKPFGIGICIIDIDDNVVCECSYENHFDKNVSKLLRTSFSNEKIFQSISERKTYLDFKQ